MLRIAHRPKHEVLITGGAGFMGANLAAHLLANTDAHLTLFDDLAEPGAAQNFEWLSGQAREGRLKLMCSDLRRASRVAEAVCRADEIYHLAPYDGRHEDSYEIQGANLVGTSNVLEAARRSDRNPAVVCASLFRSTSADRLVQDYAQVHHLAAVVLRLDSVTGPRQWAPDMDWVARVTYAVLGGCPCSVPDNPSCMHNVLHVSDAVQALLAARAYIGKTAGKAYNVSAGGAHWITVDRMIQLVECVCHCGAKIGGVDPTGLGSRSIENDSSFVIDTAWRARRSLEETVRDIAAFWHANRQEIARTALVQQLPAVLPRVQAA